MNFEILCRRTACFKLLVLNAKATYLFLKIRTDLNEMRLTNKRIPKMLLLDTHRMIMLLQYYLCTPQDQSLFTRSFLAVW